MRAPRFWLRVLLPTALLLALPAANVRAEETQIDPQAEKVIRGFAATLGEMQSFTTRIVLTSVKDNTAQTAQELSLAVARPNKIALHARAGEEEMQVVSDGKKVIIYVVRDNIYIVRDTPENVGQVLALGKSGADFLLGFFQPDPLKFYMDEAARISYIGAEEVDGAACHHLKLAQRAGKIKVDWDAWFTAAEKPLIRKLTPDLSQMPKSASNISLTISYSDWRMDPALPPETFVFTPPPDAKLLDEEAEQKTGVSSLLGQLAPALKLPLLDGGEFDLAAQKGAVVALDFWATWCGPCRVSLPMLNELAAAYKEKGVIFIAVNVGEAADDVRAFVAENKLTLSVALDQKRQVSRNYLIRGYPTSVIIGVDGTIQSAHAGLSPSPEEYIKALKAELDLLLAGEKLAPEAAK